MAEFTAEQRERLEQIRESIRERVQALDPDRRNALLFQFGPMTHVGPGIVEPVCDTAADIEALLQAAREYRALNPMTDEERSAQARSLAYGNVALHNPDVTREMVDEEARKLGI